VSNDAFLHAGLTPAADVELYPSDAAGGIAHTKAGTGIADAIGSGARSKISDRTGTGIANGVGVGGSDITYTKAGTGTASATASGVRIVDRAPTSSGGAGGRRWSPPRRFIYVPPESFVYAKTGTAVALAIGSGPSGWDRPVIRRRQQEDELVLVGAI